MALTFHPDYPINGRLFVFYVTIVNNDGGDMMTRVSEMRVDRNNPERADPWFEIPLIEIPQPYYNHNGGQVSHTSTTTTTVDR